MSEKIASDKATFLEGEGMGKRGQMDLTFQAWAIDIRPNDGHGLIGRYWWFDGCYPNIPKHMEGCRFALFKTRKLAREALPKVKGTYPEARVVHVNVSVS